MTWRATTALSVATHGHAVATAGGYVYVLGGDTGAAVANTYRATVNADGTVGSWSADAALTTARRFGRALVVRRESNAKDYVLHIGGIDGGGTALTSVLYTTQAASGALNAWTAGQSMLAGRFGHAAFAIGEYVFVAGGLNSGGAGLTSVEWNTLDGIIAGTAWASLTALPAARGRTFGARDGRVLYVVGGIDSTAGAAHNTAFRGIVTFMNDTPSVSWAETSALPLPLSRHSCLVYDHHLYIQGGSSHASAGSTTDNSDLYRAPLLADGGLGDWQLVSRLTGGHPNYRAALMLGTPADAMVLLGGHNSGGTRTVNTWREEPLTFWRQAARSDGTGLIKKVHVYLPRDQHTNLILRSEEFDNASWVKTRASVTANATTTFDGLGIADKLVEDTSVTSTHAITQSRTVLPSTAYTFTIEAKAAERSFIFLQENQANSWQATINLATGATIVTAGSCVVRNIGSGWLRISVTATMGAAQTTAIPAIYLKDNSGNLSYTGDGASGAHLARAQLEVGTEAHEYVKTEAAAATSNLTSHRLEYRYSDSWFDDGTTHENIIESITSLQRGLGTDRYPQAAEVDIVLKNDLGLVDWMLDTDTPELWLKAVVRLYVGTFEPTATEYPASAFAWFPLGEFHIAEPPKRTETAVRFGITEGSRGALVDMLRPPTLRDWYAAGGSPWSGGGINRSLQSDVFDRAVPLLFGNENIEGKLVHLATGTNTASKTIAPICATRNPSINVNDLLALRFYVAIDDEAVPFAQVPQNVPGYGNLWFISRSDAITKDGATWYIVYIQLQSSITTYLGNREWGGFKDLQIANGETLFSGQNVRASAITRFAAAVSPGSSSETASSAARVSPESVLRDIVGSYSRSGHAYVDEDAFERMEAALHRSAKCSGSLAAGDGSAMRNTMAKILASWDMDGFTDYRGRFSVTAHLKDYGSRSSDLVGLYEVYEEDVWDISDGYPAKNERWAFFNRVYTDDGKLPRPGPRNLQIHNGPWDNANTVLGTARYQDVRLSKAWRDPQEEADPWRARDLDPTPRPIIEFTTYLGILKLDLGSYFLFSWTRNIGGPYTADVFKLESMDVDLSSAQVRCTAVWVADTAEPFLIDERQYVLRSDSSGGITVTVNDSSATATFSAAGALTNVVNGDQLILKDRDETGTGTKRRRAIKLTATPTSTTATMSDPSLDFGTGGTPTAVADWEIRRSYTTAPALAFPDYPDGSELYGKISSGDPATYSDGADAHFLPD